MISMEDMKQMLHYEKIAAYVKKNKRDDLRTGILYMAGVTAVGFLTGLMAMMTELVFSRLPTSEARENPLALLGMDVNGYIIVIALSSIVGFFGIIAGIAATHYIATALGGKAKMGEYFFIGGRFLLAVGIISFVLTTISLVPCIGCIAGILALLFLPYSLYLLIVLASTLYTIDKLRAFAAITAGYLLDAIATFAVLSAIGALTGLPVGMRMIERMMEYYNTMVLPSY
ncbi:hypothetical protein H0O02_03880 [Candidatus Micrarchaeota archaeon]|nr:hypothetical protein [Candidatus Micrarchaeota archaeon]